MVRVVVIMVEWLVVGVLGRMVIVWKMLEIFIDKTTDLENYSYKVGFVVISAILKPAV